jgi:hypothetical protein
MRVGPLQYAYGCLRGVVSRLLHKDVWIGAAALVLPTLKTAFKILRRAFAALGKATRVAKLAAVVAMLVLAGGALALLLPNPGDASAPESVTPPTAMKPAFVPVMRPLRLFALEAPEFTKVSVNYEAIRSTMGDGREDDLSFGEVVNTDAPFMRIGVYRAGSEASEPAPFAVDLTRRAAAVGLSVAKIRQSEPMHPKFGDMQTADIKLSGKGVERPCIAYRRAVASEPLRIAGWYCAPIDGFAGRASLSCLIDRLNLISAGADTALRDSFVAAERRRVACGRIPMLANSAAMPSVAEGKDPPRLRGIKLR